MVVNGRQKMTISKSNKLTLTRHFAAQSSVAQLAWRKRHFERERMATAFPLLKCF